MGLVAQAALILALGIGLYHDGIAAHYREGLFEEVAARRGLPAAECYIASDWHDLGSVVLVEGRNTGRRMRCLVADVSESVDRPRHIRAMLFEVDYRAALALCGSTKLPNRDCPVRVSK